MGFDKEYMTLSVQACAIFFDVIEMCKNNSHLASIICSHEGKKVINFTTLIVKIINASMALRDFIDAYFLFKCSG